MKAAYRAAIVCGLLPLVAGTSIFALWVVTQAEWLMGAGLFVLFGGLACFGVGVLALGRYCWLALDAPEPPARFWAATLLCAALLLSNFPAAGLIVVKVARMETRYTVVLRNDAREPLEGVHLMGGGHVYAALPPVAPGESVTRAFRIRHEGPLELHAPAGTTTIDSYVTRNEGTLAFVTLGPDGNVSVDFASSED